MTKSQQNVDFRTTKRFEIDTCLTIDKIWTSNSIYILECPRAHYQLLSRAHVHSQILINQVHGSQCTKEYYIKYSWRTLADVCMVSEVLRVVPRCQVLL